MSADVLILDCAGPEMLVARGGDQGFECVRSQDLRGQAEQLNRAIDRFAEQRPLAALTEIIVNRGPGSFTGIRVAMATAFGLARGLDDETARPRLTCVNSFDLFRCGAGLPAASVMIESRRPEKYLALGAQQLILPLPDILHVLAQAPADQRQLLTDIEAQPPFWPAEVCWRFASREPDWYLAAAAASPAEPFAALYVRPPDVGPQATHRPSA